MSFHNSGWLIPVLTVTHLIIGVSCAPRGYRGKASQLPEREFWKIIKMWGVSPYFHAEGNYEVPWGPFGKVRGPFRMDANQDSLILVIGTSWDTIRIALSRYTSDNQSDFIAMAILNSLMLGQRDKIDVQSLIRVDNHYEAKARYDTIGTTLRIDKNGRPSQINTPGERLQLQDYNNKFPTRLTYKWQRGTVVLYVKNFEERR